MSGLLKSDFYKLSNEILSHLLIDRCSAYRGLRFLFRIIPLNSWAKVLSIMVPISC